jgi:hypothetical protein
MRPHLRSAKSQMASSSLVPMEESRDCRAVVHFFKHGKKEKLTVLLIYLLFRGFVFAYPGK